MATIVAPTGLTDTLLSGTSSVDWLYGAQGNDTLLGFAGNDYLDGGAGADSLIGGIGNDTYIVDNIGDVVVENAGEGVDTILSYFNLDLTSPTQFGGRLANIENFTLIGRAVFGTGNALDNSILGSGMANTLDGGAGNDSIDGGAGNDFILGGIGNDSLLGNVGNDTLDGGVGNDTLNGGSGNDCLFGGTGADSMAGGAGDDSYSVDNTRDVVTEGASQGTDIIYSSVNYTLPINVETLVLTGSAISGVGGNLSNENLVGNEWKNKLIGRGGNDTLLGMSGNDTLFGDNTLPGDSLFGNDSLVGGPGVDSLIGGKGNDTYEIDYDFRFMVTSTTERNNLLTTGKVINGDYVYQQGATPASSILWQVVAGAYINTGRTGATTALQSTDVIVEGLTPATDGTDLVRSLATFNLATNGANVENLTLIGSDHVSGTGNSLNNVLTGNIGNNSLIGGAGNDTLNGAEGSDTLIGGAGNDYYILNSETDDTTIELAGGGIDTVQTSVSFSLLSRPTFSQVENLVLTGSAILGTGNALANAITGNAQDNQLSGLGGNDKLYGGLGSDILDGGDDNDMLIGGNNTIFGGTDTDTGNDQILGGAGNDSLDGGNGNDILKGGAGKDSLVGGAGNDLLLGGTNATAGATDRDTNPNDTILGGAGNDTLDGGLGTNSLLGGLGNDLVYIRSASDVAIELPGQGNDTLMVLSDIPGSTIELSPGKYANFENASLFGNSNINLTGNESANRLSGNNGSNVIIGNAGNDTILGGAGLDYLWGDNKAGTLIGNDCLDGGISSSSSRGDTMEGGMGNDTYVVDNVNDRVRESQPVDDGGIDTVKTYVNFDPLPANDPNNVTRAPSFANLDFSSFARLENFVFLEHNDTLRGVGDGPLRGVGNALGNEFIGNTENNVIIGLGGNDTILGNDGNDSLYGDRDIETPVYDPETGQYPSNPGAYDISNLSSANQALLVGVGGALENGNDSLMGGAGDDALFGEGGKDTLLGGEGNDCLQGGAGVDSMVGGVGSDVYYVDNHDDVVIENLDEGIDVILRSIETQAALQDNVENLVIFGDALTGMGNGLDNQINVSQVGVEGEDPGVWGVTLGGGAGNDSLYGYYSSPEGASFRDAADYLTGGSGDDYLDGGKGADTLYGGLGNDTLVVDNALDAMREYNYAGNLDVGNRDLVMSSIDLDLSDTTVDRGKYIEDLTLTGGNINGLGNRLNNFITGSTGNNYLDGEAGKDTILGGDGDDCIQGGLYLGGDDSLADSLDGELGNDTYVVQSASDRIHDSGRSPAAGEFDTIETSVSFSLSSPSVSGVEILVAAGIGDRNLTGSANDDTLIGNAGKNIISGLAGKDLLLGGGGNDCILGGAGDDSINGQTGTDTLIGGTGNDTFFFDDANLDVVTGGNDADGKDVDVIRFTFDGVTTASFAGVTEVESLVTANGANRITLNAANGITSLTGGNGNDTFDGSLAVNDMVIDGASGNDSLIGGSGDDSITGNVGADFIDGRAGADTLMGGSGNDTFVGRAADVANGEIINGELGIDTVQTSDNNFSLRTSTNIENLVLLGGIGLNAFGNDEANYITGTSGNDTISGAGGDDALQGNGGNDSLIGGAGIDQLFGGAGNDSLVADADDLKPGGVVDGGTGTDEVQVDFTFSLASGSVTSIENLRLLGDTAINGTGDNNNNVITGNAGANSLVGGLGNDSLLGGAGADTLIGGVGTDSMLGEAGDDVFIVDAADTLAGGRIDGGSGTDLVMANIGFSLVNTVNVENLTLTGAGNFNATGNSSANIITGNDGNNIVNGGAGADQLLGGAGNDTLIVDASDTAFDGGFGIDWISANFDFLLKDATAVENLLLTGTAINGTGDTAANTIVGNAVNNLLNGGEGNDLLDGRGGNDMLLGGIGIDSLFGDTGNDFLNGGAGDDYLLGTSAAAKGAGEIDTLTGGSGSDTFILGDETNVFYNTSPKAGDYAIIRDFAVVQSSQAENDFLQLKGDVGIGVAGGYYINLTPVDSLGASVIANSYLYLDTDLSGGANPGDNLIAAISAKGGSALGGTGAMTTSDLYTVANLV